MVSSRRNVGWIVAHTAGTPGRATDISADSIREYHVREKGWRDIGYHFVIRFDGTVEDGRPVGEAGAHVEGFNTHSVGVCFSGNGDLAELTAAQKESWAKLAARLLREFEIDDEFSKNPMRIIGHREINTLIEKGVAHAPRTSKTCPGTKVDCSELRKLVLREMGR